MGAATGGYADGACAGGVVRAETASPAHVLLDPRGALSPLWSAQVTLHKLIVALDGTLACMGGADSIASTRTWDLARAEPWFRDAWLAVRVGRSVKYAPRGDAAGRACNLEPGGCLAY